MAKDILFTPTQFYPSTGTLTGARQGTPPPQPAVQATGTAVKGSNPGIGFVSILVFVVAMRVAWELGARL